MKRACLPPGECRPRIAALSVLPVFFELAGKSAVVAGGTEPAAWKAELLAAAGARVEVYVPAGCLSAGMASLARRQSLVRLHRRGWATQDLAGAVVAVADVQDEAEAAAFAAAAAAAGAAWNVIDRPVHCRFQFGAIVNRSPVVIGISTSGAAPVLAQALRRRIELLLPRSLAAWAQLAQAVRHAVAERLASGEARRRFWERFVERAFAAAPGADALTELPSGTGMGRSAACKHGHVSFVGAGPGDPGLLTVRAVQALQAADAILLDDLVSADVVEMARREARRIRVGRRAGRMRSRHHEIGDMMVALAKAGRCVVRLTSGDPMIGGSLDKETAALAAEGIGYDIVPGITATHVMRSTEKPASDLAPRPPSTD